MEEKLRKEKEIIPFFYFQNKSKVQIKDMPCFDYSYNCVVIKKIVNNIKYNCVSLLITPSNTEDFDKHQQLYKEIEESDIEKLTEITSIPGKLFEKHETEFIIFDQNKLLSEKDLSELIRLCTKTNPTLN